MIVSISLAYETNSPMLISYRKFLSSAMVVLIADSVSAEEVDL